MYPAIPHTAPLCHGPLRLGVTTEWNNKVETYGKSMFEKRDAMQFFEQKSPRSFAAVESEEILTYDCGSIVLASNEQVTFLDDVSGVSHTDVTRRDWGYYLTRSCNRHHLEMGWRIGIMRNAFARTYVVAVDNSKLGAFEEFLQESEHELILWVDELELGLPV
jgi:hypothetical protein